MPVSPHFQFVSAPPASATVTIDASIRTKAELLSTIARALHFPDSFGHNWDALVDSLSDLSFHAGTDATIDHASLPSLPDAELATYLGCLSAALDQLHSREVECSGLRVTFRESDTKRIAAFLDDAKPLGEPWVSMLELAPSRNAADRSRGAIVWAVAFAANRNEFLAAAAASLRSDGFEIVGDEETRAVSPANDGFAFDLPAVIDELSRCAPGTVFFDEFQFSPMGS